MELGPAFLFGSYRLLFICFFIYAYLVSLFLLMAYLVLIRPKNRAVLALYKFFRALLNDLLTKTSGNIKKKYVDIH